MSNHPFATMPQQSRLVYASFEAADEVPNDDPVRLSVDEPDPKKVVLVLGYSEPGWGFGQFTIIQTPEGVFLDTEMTNPEKVKAAFCALIDGAIVDHDPDPERHAKYNAATGTRCGPRCRTCYPEDAAERQSKEGGSGGK